MKKINILSLLLVFFAVGNLVAQISPGKLTQAHQNLEGLSNCSKCHELGDKVLNSKCLDCHKEINALNKSGHGYHASGDVKGKECFKCHSDHNGRNFEIIRLDQKNFDHQKASYPLEGKHKDLKCNQCHQSKFIKDKNLAKRKNTFLGMNQDCKSCHEDFHQGTLGSQCSNCHTPEGFRPVKSFDHNKAAFHLTGKHTEVKCDKCHKTEKKNGKEFQRFKDIPFKSCENCHNDVHQGKFGKDCEKCHVTTSFNQLKSGQFDHSKTNFQLIGKHIVVKCADCHGNNLTSKPKHAFCTDCHKDYHKGAFVKDGAVKNCAECHNENGFTPSQYTIETHNKLKFQLTGSHLAVACKDCHYKVDSWVFLQMGQRCINCHKNIHEGEIKTKFMGDNECSNCHVTDKWQKVIFDHATTDFVLLGKHKSASCESCHQVKRINDQPSIKLSSVSNRCENCHKDVHVGQFREGDKNECERCHTFDNWNPSKFDHEKTKFPLTGGHQAVPCNLCHKKVTEGLVTYIKFKLEDFKCKNCHS